MGGWEKGRETRRVSHPCRDEMSENPTCTWMFGVDDLR
jgi:hypothetical protein